ncbi:hypothetical protein [Corallococcus sicarius]|uniref:Lipoprotein n=1 Tax=Corallococcus sicarius TaxID=2316726 RepID=A0A3A8NAP6_9BACT|nr:hypothetical protein [Corallococcus sicarius]RKH39241.1 hypothetical protein D7X12_24120 [Corallococcus sicarius]
MKRSLCGLLVALAFTACKQEAPGKMEPIPRPPGSTAPAEEAAAPVAAAPAVPKDAVLLRWKLVAGAPVSFRLSLALDRNAPAFESAPAPKAAKPDKKKKGAKETPAPTAAPATAVASDYTYALELTTSGERLLRVTPAGAPSEEANVSDRGFIIDGLLGPARNLATLVLELPRDPVRPGETWSLGTELVAPDALGTQFRRATGGSERHNRVKLVSVTPGDNGEQVATLEYDLLEQFGGILTPSRTTANRAPRMAGAEGGPATVVKDELADAPAPAAPVEGTELSATVKVTGRGEFLVKAGQWRSWEGTLSSTMTGPARPAVNLPVGTYKARLEPVAAQQQAAPAPQAAPTPTATPPAP